MLALVKKPHIEISLHGEKVAELIDWIKQRFEVKVLTEEPEDEFVSIESTEYWKEMKKNRADKRVELVAEGPSAKIDELLKAVAKGPSTATVSKVEPADEPYSGEFKEFEKIMGNDD